MVAPTRRNLSKIVDELFIPNSGIPNEVLDKFKDHIITTLAGIYKMISKQDNYDALINRCVDYLTEVQNGAGLEESSEFVVGDIPYLIPIELLILACYYSEGLLPTLLAKTSQFFVMELFNLIRTDHTIRQREENFLLSKLVSRSTT